MLTKAPDMPGLLCKAIYCWSCWIDSNCEHISGDCQDIWSRQSQFKVNLNWLSLEMHEKTEDFELCKILCGDKNKWEKRRYTRHILKLALRIDFNILLAFVGIHITMTVCRPWTSILNLLSGPVLIERVMCSKNLLLRQQWSASGIHYHLYSFFSIFWDFLMIILLISRYGLLLLRFWATFEYFIPGAPLQPFTHLIHSAPFIFLFRYNQYMPVSLILLKILRPLISGSHKVNYIIPSLTCCLFKGRTDTLDF